ncbi:hypothetical protein [Nostoc sp. NMS7]|uniref:hypothetical protein n=1 Tax=Nostoc sp. NMS7 TaxID=2815391 RepID=UPI0025D9C60C|nr:hypothetical protein [Nostoc sp. NMS7]
MANPSNLNDIIQRILKGNQNDDDIEALRQWLNSGGSQNLQVGKYNVTAVFMYLNHICRRGTAMLIGVNLSLKQPLSWLCHPPGNEFLWLLAQVY